MFQVFASKYFQKPKRKCHAPLSCLNGKVLCRFIYRICKQPLLGVSRMKMLDQIISVRHNQ